MEPTLLSKEILGNPLTVRYKRPTMLNCSIILEGTAQTFGDSIAVSIEENRWTYKQLYRESCRFANGLRKSGIAHGDRIVLACPNRIEFIIAYFGILMSGAVVVPVSILSKKRELAFVMEDTQAQGFVCFEGSDELSLGTEGLDAFGEVESCRHIWMITGTTGVTSDLGDLPTMADLMEGMPDDCTSAATSPEDSAVILYTSGTTGSPKGAELSHSNIFTTAITSGRLSEFARSDVTLVTLPLFHCYAQTVQMNAGFVMGSRLVLLERFDPDLVLQKLQDEAVTVFCGVPTMYWSLLNHERADQFDLKKIAQHLRVGCSGGAPIPVEVLRGVEEKFQFNILEGYGLSETSAMASFNQIHRPRKIGSVGLPVWGVKMKIVDPDMNELPTGERGEIVIRGHCTMKGYYNRPDATEEAFRSGWFHTGDVGTMDDEGYFYVVDRTKEMIIRGGFNVYPREIEEVLATHPGISLSAVIGIPNEKYGEDILAFVILKDDCNHTPEEIVSWSKTELASYKYPRIVEIVDELPLGATGKVLKKELKKKYENS